MTGISRSKILPLMIFIPLVVILISNCSFSFEFANQFVLDDVNSFNEVFLNLSESTILTGKIIGRRGDVFSFLVLGIGDQELQRGSVDALDGVFDEKTEEFSLSIREDLPVDDYELSFYNLDVSVVDPRYTPRDVAFLCIIDY